MTRADPPSADRLTRTVNASNSGKTGTAVRVRDAATLIIHDPDGDKILMGRRSAKHTFMPGRFVFPGGRVDAADARATIAQPFHGAIEDKLGAHTHARHGPARTRALGVAAIRETFEETGVLIGTEGASPKPRSKPFAGFAARNIALDLSQMSFIARAVTPPGRPRRYDTRFFMVRADAIAATDDTVVGADAELEEIAWVPISKARELPLPAITVTVLDELGARLASDPDLSPDFQVPYYRWRGAGFVRQLL